MEIARSSEIDWAERSGGRATAGQSRTLIKLLHAGAPGAPGNFEMVLARYPAPRDYPEHRHSVDQVRLTLVGTSPWAPGRATPEGSVVYIPGGTSYGPYTRPAGIELMAVQFEAAGGIAFAGEASSQEGPFPAPRFSTPIELHPAAFAWSSPAPGVSVKEMAVLGEGGVRIAAIRLEHGAAWPVEVDQATLLFVTAGSGTAGGAPVSERDAVRLASGESCTIAGAPGVEVFVLGLNRPAGASPRLVED
jgi:hypothetical protein